MAQKGRESRDGGRVSQLSGHGRACFFLPRALQIWDSVLLHFYSLLFLMWHGLRVAILRQQLLKNQVEWEIAQEIIYKWD